MPYAVAFFRLPRHRTDPGFLAVANIQKGQPMYAKQLKGALHSKLSVELVKKLERMLEAYPKAPAAETRACVVCLQGTQWPEELPGYARPVCWPRRQLNWRLLQLRHVRVLAGDHGWRQVAEPNSRAVAAGTG